MFVDRWVDANKGDDEKPNYRSRLVAREIRQKGQDPMFAHTPPLESLRTVLSLAATSAKGYVEHDMRPDSPTRTQVSFVEIGPSRYQKLR